MMKKFEQKCKKLECKTVRKETFNIRKKSHHADCIENNLYFNVTKFASNILYVKICGNKCKQNIKSVGQFHNIIPFLAPTRRHWRGQLLGTH
jgi:hypothetical protein